MSIQTQENPSRPATATMKAVRIHEHGGPDKLRYEDAPRPIADANEVLVRVRAAGVNPVDWKIREGHIPGHRLPLTLGWDVSGVIEEVGVGVAGWRPGQEVYTRPNVMRDGAYAEFVVIAAGELALKPARIDHVAAAGVPLAGLTAWQALFEHGHLKKGQTVLVHAAAGGVGGYAVQLAKWNGARVIATASAKNEAYVKALGADVVVDYQRQRFEDVARDVDVVLDTLGGETQERSLSTLRKGGILVSTLAAPPKDKTTALGVTGVVFMAQTRPEQLKEMALLIDRGDLRSLTETVLPLSEARQAHERSQAGHVRGKIVLTVD